MTVLPCTRYSLRRNPIRRRPAPHPPSDFLAKLSISLPDSLKDFADEQVDERGYGASGDSVREPIRKDRDRRRLRDLLLAGAASTRFGLDRSLVICIASVLVDSVRIPTSQVQTPMLA
jgi:antitoxin ParD1/3/4